jgi:hypothetical protein
MLQGLTHVVDATGTYGNHNWIGRGGIPAVGEKTANIIYTIPDPAQCHAKFSNSVTAVIGSGASAITAINDLRKLSEQGGQVNLVWITRR